MKDKKLLSTDDMDLFRSAVEGTKKINQDTFVPNKTVQKKEKNQRRENSIERDHSFYFSDGYEPLLNKNGPTQYTREDVSRYEAKNLRRGIYYPEMYLDLHGMTQTDAKRELGALIAACIKEHVRCACVIHGIGKHILKQKTPLWLAQHPSVMAFHQAPKEHGGDGALLVLIEIESR